MTDQKKRERRRGSEKPTNLSSIYYHFALLCAFRPFVNVSIEDSDLHPYGICKEAAQSILALVQSYDDLFTLRRVSALVPYFVYASGLLGVAMETEGTSMNPVHLRPGRNHGGNKLEYAAEHKSPYRNGDIGPGPATNSYITMSATDHARQLLDKMGLAHLAATATRDQL
jgi:hypothetical protein